MRMLGAVAGICCTSTLIRVILGRLPPMRVAILRPLRDLEMKLVKAHGETLLAYRKTAE